MTERTAAPRATADGGGTEAAARVADVLLLFAGGPQYLGVSEISRRLGLSKAVVYRILQSLVSRNLLGTDQERPGYRLGPAAVALGVTALSRFDVRSAAAPVLRALRDETGETTTLSGLVGDERVYLDQYVSPQEIRMTVEIGRRYPLHAGSSGRVILAFLSAEHREALLARRLAPLTPHTVVSTERLRELLAETARDGMAVSLGERQVDAGSVGAPLFGPDGQVVGAISVCGPAYRFTPEVVERLRTLLPAAAAQIQANQVQATP